MELQLKGNNLYRNGILLDMDKDEFMLIRDKLTLRPSETDKYYTVMLEDELTVIAYKNYKDLVSDPSKYWWIIADANNIQNPLDLSDYETKEIVIPNIINIIPLLD